MKKQVLGAMFTIGILSAILMGCSGKGDTPAESGAVQSTGVGSETKAAGNDASKADAGAAAEITVWAWDSAFNGLAMAEADKLDENVTVNFVEMSKADCLQKIHTVLASGVTDGLPDVVLIGDLSAQGYLMSYPGAFMPMDEVINYDDFAAYKKAAVTYEDKGYGVPFDTGVAGLFYRRDYIKEAGYTDEDMQDLTWDEYLSLGSRLKEKGHMLQTFNPNDIAEFQIMLQSAGRWYTKEDGSADFIGNDALEECFGIFKTLNESDFVKVVSDWTEFTGAFNGGEVACVMRGSWISASIMAAEDQSGLWGVAPVPKLSAAGAGNKSNQGGSSWYVLQNGAHSKEAAAFLASTFGGQPELYNTLLDEKSIVGTYLPAASVNAYEKEQEFYGNQKVNADLAAWLSEVPAVNTGAFSGEAQSALQGIMPKYLSGGDLNSCLLEAAKQFEQSIQ